MQHYIQKFYSFFRHFLLALIKHYEAIEFLWMHKLWKGLFRYGWLSKGLIFFALFLGVKYFSTLWDWVTATDSFSTNSLMLLGQNSLAFWDENILSLFESSRKYIILIVTEVITFHMIRTTFSIVTGRAQDKSFNAFVRAQIRMVKVAAASWGMELGFGIVLNVILGLLGLIFLEDFMKFGLTCFFLGFALIDNFFEQYNFKVSESYKRTLQIMGASVALGLVFNGLLYIPIVGAVVAPAIGGVAAALLLAELERKGEVNCVPKIEEATEAAT